MTESKSQRKTVLNMYELGEVLARTEQKEDDYKLTREIRARDTLTAKANQLLNVTLKDLQLSHVNDSWQKIK